jgi:hypothetical protein
VGQHWLLALLLTSAAVAPSGGAAPDPGVPACAQLGAIQPSALQTASRVAADGSSELTEFFAGGMYQVYRCDRHGALKEWMTVAPIADPDKGTVTVPVAIGTEASVLSLQAGDPADPRWAARWRRWRAYWTARVIAPTSGPRTTLPAAKGGACAANAWARFPGAWQRYRYGWRMNLASFGGNRRTLTAVHRAHRHWDDDYNNCGIRDTNILVSTYVGTTKAGSHTRADGISTVDRGSMASIGCGGFVACTRDFYGTFPWFAESDQRLSSGVRFTNNGARGAYDYEGIDTHESGHTVGMAHETASRYLTMFPTAATGTTALRTLGRGDVTGVNTIYVH